MGNSININLTRKRKNEGKGLKGISENGGKRAYETEREIAGSSPKKNRKGDPSKWKKNVRKLNRTQGKKYVNCKGISMPEKVFIDHICVC